MVGGLCVLVDVVADRGDVMSHEHCRTYFNVALIRCEHCEMFWCPRCRRWFGGAAEQIGVAS